MAFSPERSMTMKKTAIIKMNSYNVTFNSQAEIDQFVSNNFVDLEELGFPLLVGQTYKVVDDEAYGWWIEEV